MSMKPLILQQLEGPSDLDGRSVEELEALCVHMRAALVDKVLATGGHLGSNLGVVEMTVALHKIFDFQRDRIVFDVSHQSYPHKMLTGRYDEFQSLRQTGGMSGFCSRTESEYDMLTAGHAGTAISFAMGLAEGMRGQGGDEEDPWSVALVGDAGIACGVAFEGLNHAGERKPRLLVVLNDNEWSIAQSVGAMSRYLARIRTSKTLQGAYSRLSDLAHSIPWIGERLDELGEVLRHAVVPGHVFEELGVNYVGPLDGHNLSGCMEAFERIKRMDGVHLVHLLTEKGRGYEPAKGDAERAHGVKPSSPKVPRPHPEVAVDAPPSEAFTKVFGRAVTELAQKDSRVVALTAAMPSGTGLTGFASQHPDRFFDTGITEQHAVAMAGGLATAGKRPVVAIYSSFLQRGYDQVFQEVALQEERVVFALDRAGFVGQDGPTHMGLYDLAYLRALPGMVLASPRDAIDLERMLEAGVKAEGGPWALRWPRGNAQLCLGAPQELRPELVPGTAEKLREGQHGAVLALGAMVAPAMEAAELLAEQGLQLEVWDARFCRPLDVGVLADLGRRHGQIATVEEHSLNGGFGSAVAESIADLGISARLSRHGAADRWHAHATSRDEQLAWNGLTGPLLAEAWKEFFVAQDSGVPTTSP